MSEPLTYDSDRLIREWRERYANRRTVTHQMLSDAEKLVRDAIARELEQECREAKTQREWDLERRERQVEHAEGMEGWKVDRLRRQLAEAEVKIASMSPRMTQMREERETVEEGTIIRLLAPTVPSYGDKTSARPWRMGELEDVIYRLHLGGAADDTEVRFKRDAIEACVPCPEFALAPAPQRESAPESVTTSPVSFRTLVAGCVVGLLAFVIFALVVILR